MKGVTQDLGNFEGFNFRDQEPILLTLDEVLEWDHDEQGEAEFWPDGGNRFVSLLLPRPFSCTGDLEEVARIFEEVNGEESELAKAVYLRECGVSLDEITSREIDDRGLYVFGPGFFSDLRREAGFELFETFHPDLYRAWSEANITGLDFEPDQFLKDLVTSEIATGEHDGHWSYLIVDIA